MSGTIHLISKKDVNSITNTSFYNSPQLPKKHNHIEIILENLSIIYNDPRRFGFFKIIENNEKLKQFFKNYGPEPFDKKFNIQYFKKSLKNKTKNIKNYLLDQKFVSGIGNIYANEILYFCKINPFKQSKSLNKKDYKNIIFYSKKVLKNAIKKGGSSIQNFTNTQGNKGSFQDNFKVYQRDKLNCLRKDCNGKIEKKMISNRSVFYCNKCQK
jgi:formamidopyrimidine-DNA glycosylase